VESMDIGPRRRRESVPGGLDVASLPHTLPPPTPLNSTGLRLMGDLCGTPVIMAMVLPLMPSLSPPDYPPMMSIPILVRRDQQHKIPL